MLICGVVVTACWHLMLDGDVLDMGTELALLAVEFSVSVILTYAICASVLSGQRIGVRQLVTHPCARNLGYLAVLYGFYVVVAELIFRLIDLLPEAYEIPTSMLAGTFILFLIGRYGTALPAALAEGHMSLSQAAQRGGAISIIWRHLVIIALAVAVFVALLFIETQLWSEDAVPRFLNFENLGVLVLLVVGMVASNIVLTKAYLGHYRAPGHAP